jgi:phenylpyruvate tautomerase PptA (4-oxalocrotonate tautomerase family)
VLVTVDTSSAESNLNNAAENLEESFEDQGYTADAENVFITAAPTFVPSTSPSIAPVSTIPSAVPSITGAVASVTISGTATEDLPAEEIENITSDLAEIYGVDPSDVETTIDYVASGTLDDVAEEDAIAALQDFISDVLHVHSSDVVVTIEDDGSVSYSVIGATYMRKQNRFKMQLLKLILHHKLLMTSLIMNLP